jgi:hypothetical protein
MVALTQPSQQNGDITSDALDRITHLILSAGRIEGSSHGQRAGWYFLVTPKRRSTLSQKAKVSFLIASCFEPSSSQHQDPSHFMMSGTLAALSSFNGSLTERDELGEYCKQLIPRLADPHLRALITRLTSEQWTDVLAQPGLPFRERIAIALHFLDDAGLSAYLQRMSDECRSRGDIEGLLLTGVTSSSAADLLQTWLDRTGDIQTVAVMAAWMPLDMQIDRWTDAYRGLLDAWRMFHERVEFDMERGDILGRLQQTGISDQARWAPKTVLIRCNYCQKTLDGPDAGYDGRVRNGYLWLSCSDADYSPSPQFARTASDSFLVARYVYWRSKSCRIMLGLRRLPAIP